MTSLVTFVYIQSVIYMASGGDGNFPEYKIRCNELEPLAASATAESSSNSALSEQLPSVLIFCFLTYQLKRLRRATKLLSYQIHVHMTSGQQLLLLPHNDKNLQTFK